jgi:hypothetical protein
MREARRARHRLRTGIVLGAGGGAGEAPPFKFYVGGPLKGNSGCRGSFKDEVGLSSI